MLKTPELISWHNNKTSNGSTVEFDLNDRGLLLGDGIFETLLAINGIVQNQDDHLQRMKKAAKFLDIPFSEKSFKQATQALAQTTGAWALRITLTRGTTERGLHMNSEVMPNLFGTARPYDTSRMYEKVSLGLSGIHRNETSPTSQMKTLGYLDGILALREALQKGFDDALFLNTQGNVACTTMANVFILKGNTLFTPPRKDGVLEGTVRKKIIKGVHEMNVECKETSITYEQIFSADAIFITNSLRIIAPVHKFEHKILNSEKHPFMIEMIKRCRAVNEAIKS